MCAALSLMTKLANGAAFGDRAAFATARRCTLAKTRIAAFATGRVAMLAAATLWTTALAACTSGDSAERERARAITDHFDTGQQIADEVVPGVDDPDTDGDAFVCA